jgi:HK97 gp10 family phage protein
MPVTARLTSSLGAIARDMEPKAQMVVDKTALDIEAGAKARSRVDTSAMKNAWHTVAVGALESEVRNGMDYVIFNEYGTRHMSPQPMATPAAEEAREGFVQAMRSIVQ